MTTTPEDSVRSLAPSGSRQGGLSALLWDPRLKPIWILVMIGCVLFSGFRMGLFLTRLGEMGDLDVGKVAQCFLMGLRYDAVAIGCALLPLVLALSLAPDRALGQRGFQRAVAAYATALVTVAVFVEIIGVSFFYKFGRRINWLAVTYPFRNPREVLGHIWTVYPVWLFLPGMVLICYVCYRLIHRIFWRGPVRATPRWRRVLQAIVLTGLCLLACRGGLAPRPLRRGSAYFTSNFLVTQLTMNNFFTLFHAAKGTLTEGGEQEQEYPRPPIAEAMQVAARMLYQPHDRPVPNAPNPLWRRTETGRPQQDYNVVLIIMEGMACRPVGALGYSPSHTPRLDALSQNGIFFERMYAVGRRTSHALVAILCGHPDLEGATLLQLERAQGKFLTLPAILQERGYETLFVYGGDGDFDNMRGFFTAGGIRRFIDEEEMDAGAIPGNWNWGLPDEIILGKAAEELEKLGDRKFFAVILTVSNHDPYQIPPGRIAELPGQDDDTRRFNAYRYSDWALGEFLRRAERSSYFRRTIFVLVADHGHKLNPVVSIDVPGYRMLCLFYAPGLLGPRSVSTVCSQTDISPTLLHLLGGSFEHCFLGRNILAVAPGDGFAMMHQEDLGFVRDSTALVLPPNPAEREQPIPVLFRTDWYRMDPIQPDKADPRQLEGLQKQMLSYFVTARHLYVSQRYVRSSRMGHAPERQAP